MKIQVKKITLTLLGLCCTLLASNAFAVASDINAMASAMQSSLTPIINLIVASCYLGGAGFFAGAIFKFKAHKDNPTQVPIGQPIMLLFVGAGLLFLPSIINLMANSFGLSGGVQAFNFTSGKIV